MRQIIIIIAAGALALVAFYALVLLSIWKGVH